MNSAPADNKLDAVAAVVTKLVEQRKAMHEHMQKMMSANEEARNGHAPNDDGHGQGRRRTRGDTSNINRLMILNCRKLRQ